MNIVVEKGQRYGTFTIVRSGVGDAGGRERWWARCVCGNERLLYTERLLRKGYPGKCPICGPGNEPLFE